MSKQVDDDAWVLDADAQVENNHNVMILGAGFSACAGMPVVSNFLDQMRYAIHWFERTDRNDEVLAIANVLMFLHRAAAAGYRTTFDPENVEELFCLASALGGEATTRDMIVAISATLDFCAQKAPQPPLHFITPRHIADSIGLKPSLKQGLLHEQLVEFDPTVPEYIVAALLGKLGDAGSDAKNTILSFNYDLLVETAASRLGLGVDYSVGDRVVDHRSSKTGEIGAAVPLLKLHGSVNWAFNGDRQLCVFEDYKSLRDAGQIPLLVPPTWRKTFTDHFELIWQRAVVALRTATRICIVGFSMPETDIHFRYLLCAGLRDNISLRKILFVDPNVGHLRQRIERLFRAELITRGTIELRQETIQRTVLDETAMRKLGRPRFAETSPLSWQGI